jgi:hypothetical protein
MSKPNEYLFMLSTRNIDGISYLDDSQVLLYARLMTAQRNYITQYREIRLYASLKIIIVLDLGFPNLEILNACFWALRKIYFCYAILRQSEKRGIIN